MSFLNWQDTKRGKQLLAQRLRQQAWDDGYNRRPCASSLRDYQVSYRLGSIARDAMEEAGEEE